MPQFYTVRSGETLTAIARMLGTAVEKLLALNQIEDPNLIFPGQTLLVSVDGIDTGDGERSINSRVIDGLLYVLVTNRRMYDRGEPVNITLTKINVTRRPITLTYTSGQRFEFEALRADGTVVWRWSRGMVFTQVTETITLRPGETQVFTAVWDQRNQQGNLVVPQTITIRGYNWAVNLRNRFVSTRIIIERGAATQPPQVCQPGVDLLINSGFEDWPNIDAPPPGWTGQNVSRQGLIRHTGRYSARLGTNPRREASISQTVTARGGRLYRLAYWLREIPQVPPGSNFRLRARVFFYNAAGRLISTADPEYSENVIPENFIQFNFTTGISPAETRSLEARFIFMPEPGNNNPVALDDVFLECLR